jgi:MoaA/NifB/PqqE/SkfB family radical SAM enzyme
MSSFADYARTALRVARKDGPPLHLVFFITNLCDFACQHCFLIANGELNNKSRRVLTLEEIERVAASVPDLVALSLTGGEPFLRKDYAAIVDAFARQTRLKTLSTVSNGISAERILPQLLPVLECRALDVFLTLSLDGSEATHDEIRRKPGGFKRTIATLRELRPLRERYPRFSLGVNSTYIGTNYADLMELYDALEDEGPHFVTLNMMRGVDWVDRPQGLSTDEYRRLSARKNALAAKLGPARSPIQRMVAAKDAVMTELIAETYDRHASLFPCYGGRLFGVLKDNGDVFPCEQLNGAFGNVREHDLDFMAVWRSAAADRERQDIVQGKCHCTYECVMAANVLFNPRFYPRLAAAALRTSI